MKKLVMALLVLMVLVPLQARADGTRTRPMTAAEETAHRNAVQALFKAAPPAPQGYTRSVKPSLEDNLKIFGVDDYPKNITGCLFAFSYTVTVEMKNAASAKLMQESMQEAAADPALMEEQKMLQNERKDARRKGDKDALARIEMQLAVIKKKIKAEEEKKFAEKMADPQGYMKKLLARQPVENITLEMGYNSSVVNLDHFRTYAPTTADPSGKILVSEIREGHFGVLRYFGKYMFEEREYQSALIFKSADNMVHTRPQVAYAFIRTDENGKDFAVELLKKLDAATLEGMVK